MSDLDTLFQILSDGTRRQILTELLVNDGVHVPDDVRTHSETHTRPTRIPLHHIHLPKLAEAGYIEWSGQQHVTRGPNFGTIEPTLRLLLENEDKLPGRMPRRQ